MEYDDYIFTKNCVAISLKLTLMFFSFNEHDSSISSSVVNEVKVNKIKCIELQVLHFGEISVHRVDCSTF